MSNVTESADNRILVVEDTPSNIQILASVLKEKGYQVSIATNGKQALEVIDRVKPALILLDVMMPEMDGFEACRRLKENAEWSQIPVIFLTARTETADIIKGFELGAVDYVAKPFNTHEVLARVATHLAMRRQQRELLENYQRLSELERLRDSLVHMVVHDLRSPLLGLSGCLQLLQGDLEGKLEPEQSEDLESALSAAQRLSEMVSSLLDVSRMEAGQMPLNRQTVDLQEVITGAVNSLGGLTRNRKVSVTASEGPVTANCDPDVATRIVANLVANALKFTPASGEVRVSATPEGDFVRIGIADTGPGIPPQYRDRIFEKFGQVEERQEGHKHSTGLGLTFCKLAAEAHGGMIGVDSEVGQGSTFWFTLPRQ
jgi:two-component system, sensor histidine kinase and response regulator